MYHDKLVNNSPQQYTVYKVPVHSTTHNTTYIALPSSSSSSPPSPFASVEQVLLARGWARQRDTTATAFTLKWTERKQHINFTNFREGTTWSCVYIYI